MDAWFERTLVICLMAFYTWSTFWKSLLAEMSKRMSSKTPIFACFWYGSAPVKMHGSPLISLFVYSAERLLFLCLDLLIACVMLLFAVRGIFCESILSFRSRRSIGNRENLHASFFVTGLKLLFSRGMKRVRVRRGENIGEEFSGK